MVVYQNSRDLVCGVPQGSYLGPLLFTERAEIVFFMQI